MLWPIWFVADIVVSPCGDGDDAGGLTLSRFPSSAAAAPATDEGKWSRTQRGRFFHWTSLMFRTYNAPVLYEPIGCTPSGGRGTGHLVVRRRVQS